MIFHTHKEDPALVRGAPDPSDQTDAIAVVVGECADESFWYAYPRAEWAPLIRILRRIADGGRARADRSRLA